MSQHSVALGIGTTVEGYRVEAVLGQGTFGITYLVRDKNLGLQFALKEYLPRSIATRSPKGDVVPSSSGQRQEFTKGLQQFLQEGQTLAQLNHPNVVKILRYFEARGTAFLLMTYYEGQPLNKLLEHGGVFDAIEIKALTAPLLDALEHIHSHRIIHRDIKPANIYVTRKGDPILLDFGAARVASASSADKVTLIGSEGYAALEQSLSDGMLGPWTDIYGLAATLYRLLTGEIPTAANLRWQSLSGGGDDPLEPLSKRVGRHLNPGYLGAIELGLMVPADKRPKSVKEWREAFEPPSIARKPGKTPSPQTKTDGNFESENENEHLPKIVAGVFAVLLIAMILYLVLAPGKDPGEAEKTVVKEELQPVPDPAQSRIKDAEAWEQAVRVDSKSGYQSYLEAFPAGINAPDALAQLELFDEESWKQAVAQNNRSAYESYLLEFPAGKHHIDAKSRADTMRAAEEEIENARIESEKTDNTAWVKARNARSLSAIDGYIAQFPNGINLTEARMLRDAVDRELKDDVAFESAKSINQKDSYQAYLNAYPQGRHLTEVLSLIDELVMRPGKEFKDCENCPAMVVIPAGAFQQGSDSASPNARSNEQPKRTVRISNMFAMSKNEVTISEWDFCAAEGGCKQQANDGGFGRGNRPVIWVSWEDAQQFAGWLSQKTGQVYDLPSESQWEYAARGGEASDWLGRQPGTVCEFGNVAGSESGFQWRHSQCGDAFIVGSAIVGSFKPNSFGLYDMIGNVAEWTRDCMNLSYLDAPADGSAWERGICASRITRGGSWFSGSNEIRLPARFHLKAGERNDFTGFRVVRQIQE